MFCQRHHHQQRMIFSAATKLHKHTRMSSISTVAACSVLREKRRGKDALDWNIKLFLIKWEREKKKINENFFKKTGI